MQQQITLKLLPSEAGDSSTLTKIISSAAGKKPGEITGYYIVKRSIDARAKTTWINLTLTVFINEPFEGRPLQKFVFKDVTAAKKKVVIIGAGPAALFAALGLLTQGIKPVIVERGKEVRARRRDLALLNREGVINADSNYCFGEGGAGTYSDGKLYTRSSRRGNIDRILQLFVHFGAEDSILYEAHPHIGTNKLPQIITSMRQRIVECGGEYLFEKKVVDLTIVKDKVKNVRTADGDTIEGDAFVLATGHSARDIYELLYHKNILIHAKPFALGVRVEHPQNLIDSIQYKRPNEEERSPQSNSLLPPASYSLVEQVNGRGVFSFCMCPGGIIAPAETAEGEVVVNGWSPSKRNNPYANSGIVVQVETTDAFEVLKKNKQQPNEDDPRLVMLFQKMVEQRAYAAGGGKFVAPAQRMVDFVQNKVSTSLPGCSYLPGLHPADLRDVLPSFIYKRLQTGLKRFGGKMKGYYTNEAIIVATESRTSSTIRIPRNPITLAHPQLTNLYPCGEGAGYAGGIVSAAMDGEKVALQIVAVNTL